MIAILGAMQEEITPMLELIGEYEKIDYASNTFYKAKFHGKDIIIAYSKIGKVNAAITATVMIEKFKAEKLLFSGVAGSLNPNLHICDIIYATKVAQHDLDITAFGHPHGYVPGIEVFCKTDNALNQIAMSVAKEQSINLIGGVVASGDQFICAQDKKDWIKATFNADAVEMEGASVGQVCAQLNVPFFMLRAISDEASGGADMDFDEFLDKSAKISAKFVLEMVKKI
ncbi:Aminodeoxyfutalosine nucleosidase [Campylobacter majalis]|uniref:adenosylhomocysteine nucleosidase n=1 Tax=Campylobacter majalis TaxID=2790656 RepID=A0ABN7K521_9BACT|nr:5'-methylthioadenosine/adenosylhomocysteine nucleosidase [Campylobacter majalis]CAD7287584.1 Aminodeoxyfutalosine nucleosidase [Campylobacter majalis]